MADTYETTVLALAKTFASRRSSVGMVGAFPNAMVTPAEMMAVLSGMSSGVAHAIDLKADAGCVPETWATDEGIALPPFYSPVKSIAFLAGVPADEGAQAWRRSQVPGVLPSVVYVPAQKPALTNQQTDQIVAVRELIAEYQAALAIVTEAVWTYGSNVASGSSCKAFWSAVDNLAAHLDSAGEFPPKKWTTDLGGASSYAVAQSGEAIKKLSKKGAETAGDVLNWAAETTAGLVSSFVGALSPLVIIAGAIAFTAWKAGFL